MDGPGTSSGRGCDRFTSTAGAETEAGAGAENVRTIATITHNTSATGTNRCPMTPTPVHEDPRPLTANPPAP
jgi:hypothetical protein